MSAKHWKLGIIGWPLGYSLSPLMHDAALKAAGLKGDYKRYPVKSEDLERWLVTDALELNGFNVTMPHKKAVFHWLERCGKFNQPELIRAVGAVNTIKMQDGRAVGSNTDGMGFLEPIDLNSVRGKRVLLFGAGGAAQAIAVYLAYSGQIGSLEIWNRHWERADMLARRIQELHAPCSEQVRAERLLRDVPIREMELLINATPAGMKEEEDLPLDYGQLHAGQIVYDIVYEPKETRLMREARERGCQVITGDEMLAAQGAAAFEIWTKVPAAKVLPAMKKALDEHFAART